MKISEFKNSIDWKMFGKIMSIISFIILFSILQPNSILNLAQGISFILIISVSLLSRVYIELKLRETSKILTIKKLKKLNRWKFLKN